MEIKKGQIWRCVNEQGWNGTFTKGKEYKITDEKINFGGIITTNFEDSNHTIPSGFLFNDFRLIETGTPEYHNNEKGSIYKFCENEELNFFEFDIIKGIVNCRKNGDFNQNLKNIREIVDNYERHYK